ncbi:MAG: Gfo/Idh/MocA family oxidoreductase [Candidatus Hydrogenedentes bacterium]|nr:Gfo/Idh/MocA family oxidoreductase [Candidatus Hydrogenedentota bacterium]
MALSPLSRRSFLQASAMLGLATATAAEKGTTAAPFRIGIVASDNSHAQAFSALTNLPKGKGGLKIDGAIVTHICGADPARTKEVAEASNIPNMLTDDEKTKMIGEVDGVLCVRRHGGNHLEDVRPFLEAGIPAFVDKPLSCSVEDAQEIIRLAQEAKVGFSSFSTLRYAQPTVEFLQKLQADAGPLKTGNVAGPCDPASEYGGVFFYGIHVVELMNATFGYGCDEVEAVSHGDTILVNCKYPDGKLVALHLMHNTKYVFHITAFGEKDFGAHTVDSSTSYYDGLKVILHTMKTGEWPLTADQLLEPVRILAAIDRSLKEGGSVRI